MFSKDRHSTPYIHRHNSRLYICKGGSQMLCLQSLKLRTRTGQKQMLSHMEFPHFWLAAEHDTCWEERQTKPYMCKSLEASVVLLISLPVFAARLFFPQGNPMLNYVHGKWITRLLLSPGMMEYVATLGIKNNRSLWLKSQPHMES